MPARPSESTIRVGTGSRRDSPPSLTLLVSGAQGVQMVSLVRRSYVLGRDTSCDIQIDDASVSRKHAALAVDVMTLEDLGSMNGTKVAGERLLPSKPAPVAMGTLMEIGSVTLLLLPAAGLLEAPADGARARAPRRPANEAPVIEDDVTKRLYAMLDVIAPSPLSVLVLGETGVGKEVFAEEIHRRSPRAAGPFVALNCAAIPESMLESELFGHEKGAFTGASQAKPGLFESADGGTIFLDEIGDVPAAMQAKLLRVLEKGEILRLGSVRPKKIDVRVVSATNQDLRARIVDGRFRSDLFFRLDGITVTLPPLRQRTGDILPLVHRFIAVAAKRAGKRAPPVSERAAEALRGHAWPGNVRELRSVVERAVLLAAGPAIDMGELAAAAPEAFAATGTSPTVVASARVEPRKSAEGDGPGKLKDKMRDFERAQIVRALEKCNGGQREAAKMLGISRRALLYKIEQYAIERPRKRAR